VDDFLKWDEKYVWNVFVIDAYAQFQESLKICG
jgi:hypothetical protein